VWEGLIIFKYDEISSKRQQRVPPQSKTILRKTTGIMAGVLQIIVSRETQRILVELSIP